MTKFMVVLAALLLATTAQATDDPCSHPVFVTHECLASTVTNGQDGEDGQDGKDGRDGIDGVDGINGLDGLDGKDGVIPREWIDRMYNSGRYSLALDSIVSQLPYEAKNRFTMGAAQADNMLAIGFSIAHVNEGDERASWSLGAGFSDKRWAFKAAFGFEF